MTWPWTLSRHPEGELVAYLRGELEASARQRVDGHVRGCVECRDRLAAFDGVVRELARSLPEPPPVHWGRYRAELRARLEAPRPALATWRSRPVPLALSAVLAGMLVVIAVSGLPRGRGVDIPAPEERVIASELELLRTYPVVEQLDLLENLDMIRQLDRLAPTRES